MANVFTLELTGMSGSGKSTLAKALQEALESVGTHVQVIDGDTLRSELGSLFGYTREERMKNSRIVRVLARYLNRNGVNVILSVVAPYEEMRRAFREFIGVPYIEAYVKCSLEECARRDVKGYYRAQMEGKMQNLNGADDVFDEPQGCDLVVDTEHSSVDECSGQILEYLGRKGYVVPIHHG